MLCVRLWAVTTKPTAQPWRCQAFSEASFQWHDEYFSYLQSRGIQTKIQNTKAEKLKDNLDLMEKQLSASNPVYVFWRGSAKQELQVLLENSTVITLTLDEYSGNITKIVVDSILGEFIPHSIVSSVRATGYFAAGLTNKQLVFIQHKKNVVLSEAKKSSDLVSTMYTDATDVIRELVLDEGRKLLITNSTKQFNVCSVVADKKAMTLVELDKYVPSSPKYKTRFPKFSVLHNDTIYNIEEKTNECIELQVFLFTKRKLKLQNRVKMPYNKNNDIQLKCGDLSPDESVWALGFSDGTVIVYNLTTGGDKVVNSFARGYVATVKWNKTSSVLLVCYREGTVLMLDRALQPLNFIFDDGFSTFMLDFPTLLGRKLVKLISAGWASEGEVGLGPFSSSRSSSKADTRPKDYECAYDDVAIAVHGGPIVIMRIELGAFNKGKLSNSVVLGMRLNNLQIQESLEILLLISSNTEFYLCFSRMVDFLLKVDSFDPYDYLELLFEKCWHLFIDQKSKFLEPARNLYIRYVNRLIKDERFEAAFKAAVQIDTPELFMQLRMCAINTPLIAEAATLRLQTLYNVYNSFDTGLLKKIIDDANKFKDEILEKGLQLETQGRLTEARELYIAHGRVEEERRVNLISQFVGDAE